MALKQDFHVLVIGAGATGLLIAQGLKKAGISYTVYERTDASTYKHRQRDWTMALHWGTKFLSKCLPPDMVAGMKSIQTDPWIDLSEDDEKHLQFWDGVTGDLLCKVPSDSSRRVSREKLRKYLARGAEPKFGKKLDGIEVVGAKVVAHFSDGTQDTGDALVGADSAGSFVRQWLLPGGVADLTNLPMIFYNLSTQYTAEQAKYIRDNKHPLFKFAVHLEAQSVFMIFPSDIRDPNDPATWSFQIVVTLWGDSRVPDTSEARLAHIKHLGSKYCEPFRSAAMWLKDDTNVPSQSQIKNWENPVPWNNHEGRVTLAGDAAHAMSPFRAQGLNNGLCDAANYVEAIEKALSDAEGQADEAIKLKEMMDAYDADVLLRGSNEIRVSAIQTKMFHHGAAFLNSPMAKFGALRMKQMQIDATV